MTSSVLHIAPEYNLSRYLQEIHKFPFLLPEEEVALARRWHNGQDTQAMHKLVTSHLRLVAKIAMGYRGYGLPVGELISEGNVGLMQAAKRFDPDRGFRLATYAIWWIRAAIQEYVLHSWSLVKMATTAAQKKLFFNLRRLKGQMQAIQDGHLKPEQVAEIAKTLGLPEQDVISMNRRLAAPDHSLNAPMRSDSEGEWQDWLADECETQESALAEREELSGRQALLPSARKTLNGRERYILIARRLKDEPATLEELSMQYGISRERVRQIEVCAFEKLQKATRAQIIDRKLHVCLEGDNQKLCLIKAAHKSNKSSGDCLWSSHRAIGGAPDQPRALARVLAQSCDSGPWPKAIPNRGTARRMGGCRIGREIRHFSRTSIRSQRSVSRTATTIRRVNRILQTKSDVSRFSDSVGTRRAEKLQESRSNGIDTRKPVTM